MAKDTVTYEDFLNDVPLPYRAFVEQVNSSLLDAGYKSTFENKASGYLASYKHGKNRLAILNFVFRKKGMMARVYANHCDEYADYVATLPPALERVVAKASDCKRLLNPSDCSPTCSMGYRFSVGDNEYRKCRYNCFFFLVDDESVPVIAGLVERERVARG